MNKFIQEIKKRVLVFDGSKGTMLQKMGLNGQECPEFWNLKHPSKVEELYKSYIQAGSDVIQTNTFGANKIILEKFNLQNTVSEINSSSVKLAKNVVQDKTYIAASIGPTGKLLEPSGDLTFEQAYEIFKEQVQAVTQAGADIINIETMTDLTEMRTAILAARENSPLPIIASMTFEPNGYTLMGNSPATCAITCESLGVDLVGANCSTGPENLLNIIKEMYKYTNLPLCVKPNAGMPRYIEDNIIYDATPGTFKNTVKDFIQHGVRLIGGCCGTTPEFISEIKNEIESLSPVNLTRKSNLNIGSFICSASKFIDVTNITPSKIGIFFNNSNYNNFTISKMDIILDRTFELMSDNYNAVYIDLDVLNNSELSPEIVKNIQMYSKFPLIFKSNSSECIESVLRVYNGKAGIVIDGINDCSFDLIISAKKYGSTIIDKNNI